MFTTKPLSIENYKGREYLKTSVHYSWFSWIMVITIWSIKRFCFRTFLEPGLWDPLESISILSSDVACCRYCLRSWFCLRILFPLILDAIYTEYKVNESLSILFQYQYNRMIVWHFLFHLNCKKCQRTKKEWLRANIIIEPSDNVTDWF